MTTRVWASHSESMWQARPAEQDAHSRGLRRISAGVAAVSFEGLVEAADHWELPLEGAEVTRCCIDYALTLVLTGPDVFCV